MEVFQLKISVAVMMTNWTRTTPRGTEGRLHNGAELCRRVGMGLGRSVNDVEVWKRAGKYLAGLQHNVWDVDDGLR